MNYYIIHVQDILESGTDLVGTSKEFPWLTGVIKGAVSGEILNIEANVSARLVRSARTIEVIGGVYLEFDINCDKCLNSFRFMQQIPFRILLEPAPDANTLKDESKEEMEDVSEALDFCFYESADIDIGDIIRQHIAMEQPISHICTEGCKGLCPQCGVDLNKKACKCREKAEKSPFAVLKGVKVKKK